VQCPLAWVASVATVAPPTIRGRWSPDEYSKLTQAEAKGPRQSISDGLFLPHLTRATKPCPATPHTPRGVVVWQIRCNGCPTRATPHRGNRGRVEMHTRTGPRVARLLRSSCVGGDAGIDQLHARYACLRNNGQLPIGSQHIAPGYWHSGYRIRSHTSIYDSVFNDLSDLAGASSVLRQHFVSAACEASNGLTWSAWLNSARCAPPCCSCLSNNRNQPGEAHEPRPNCGQGLRHRGANLVGVGEAQEISATFLLKTARRKTRPGMPAPSKPIADLYLISRLSFADLCRISVAHLHHVLCVALRFLAAAFPKHSSTTTTLAHT
jgi:hypothetical protein